MNSKSNVLPCVCVGSDIICVKLYDVKRFMRLVLAVMILVLKSPVIAMRLQLYVLYDIVSSSKFVSGCFTTYHEITWHKSTLTMIFLTCLRLYSQIFRQLIGTVLQNWSQNKD